MNGAGFGIEVSYSYRECSLEGHREENEKLMRRQAARMIRNTSFAGRAVAEQKKESGGNGSGAGRIRRTGRCPGGGEKAGREAGTEAEQPLQQKGQSSS